MLESIKKRRSIKMKDVFKIMVNETYEGAERRLDGRFAFPASRLVTPNGHPNVSNESPHAVNNIESLYHIHVCILWLVFTDLPDKMNAT